MKVRTYGALMGALLAISAVDAAQAEPCGCIEAPHHHAATHYSEQRHAPAHSVRQEAGADVEYAQSYYDYESSSYVEESFGHHGHRFHGGWRVAPNDAHIRFYHDDRVVYGPETYSQSYYGARHHDYGVSLDEGGFSGGVGYGEDGGAYGGGGGYGGGYGGYYSSQNGGLDEPANGGGVNLPGGYGPTYRGNWSGQGTPTQGGGAGIVGTKK